MVQGPGAARLGGSARDPDIEPVGIQNAEVGQPPRLLHQRRDPRRPAGDRTGVARRDVLDHHDQFDAKAGPLARFGVHRMFRGQLRRGAQPKDSAFAADGDVAARRLAQNLETENIPIEGDRTLDVADKQLGAQRRLRRLPVPFRTFIHALNMEATANLGNVRATPPCQRTPYTIGGYAMAHLSSQNEALLKRVRRIAGQVEAIERSIAGHAPCADTLHLVAATRGAINGLLDEVVEAHLREHVAKPGLDDAARAEAAEQVIEAIRRYSK